MNSIVLSFVYLFRLCNKKASVKKVLLRYCHKTKVETHDFMKMFYVQIFLMEKNNCRGRL